MAKIPETRTARDSRLYRDRLGYLHDAAAVCVGTLHLLFRDDLIRRTDVHSRL
jgi:hypothetical protein